MKFNTRFLISVLILSFFIVSPAQAQVTVSGVSWHRELAPAMAEARESAKGILAFFADPESDRSNRSWTGLHHARVLPIIRASYVPLLVDCVGQKALATQLGVSETGVAVLYSAEGNAVRMLSADEIADPDRLAGALKPSGGSGGTALFAMAAQSAATSAPAASARPAPGLFSSVTPTPASADPLADAVPAEQVRREHLGQEVVVTGAIVVVEPSTGPRSLSSLTLTRRSQDPVQVVYGQDVADKIHAGRPLPKEGDVVTARGTLTDDQGRLQIKISSPRQIRLH